MRRFINSIIVIIIVVNGNFLLFSDLPEVEGEYIPHEPIYINGDSDFIQTSEDEGWEGNGSYDNPIIISGYEIEAERNGVTITYTSLHFVISDSYVVFNGDPGETLFFDYYGIDLYNVRNGVIRNCTIENFYYGFYLRETNSCIFTNNTLKRNNNGINTVVSNSDYFVDNTITNNTNNGIHLYSSKGAFVANNTIYDNRNNGIYILYGYRNTIMQNEIFNNGAYGIEIRSSHSNILINNHIQSNIEDGISLWDSYRNDITYNSILDNGIRLRGYELHKHDANNINSSNTINGKPFHFYQHQTGGVISHKVGQIIMYNCTNMIIRNQDITQTSIGIFIARSSNISITKNRINNNKMYGLLLYSSTNNSISHNSISHNSQGIYFDDSSNNSFTYNTVSHNTENGIFLIDSVENVFHHNDIIDNEVNEAPFTTLCTWSDGYGEGNYWSDYEGLDLNADGVGDTNLPHRGVDDHPLMSPSGSSIKEDLPMIFYLFLVLLIISVVSVFIISVRLRRKNKGTNTQNKDGSREKSIETKENE